MAKGFILDKNDAGEYFVSFKRDNNDLDLRIQGESPSTDITHEEITSILEKYGLSTVTCTVDKEQVLAAARELNFVAGINNK
ncbi:hypothetical protein LGL55_03790 [Clostridium tagluense]|uniref:hypothetical protein n=1 Tax=Clostridium tagluense TaxID=360422 RepID=UPI001C0CFDAC|nr:hypothetical protein [Clostridium tagluense]MBU3129268.1 hypothetical protein [Clostridium tagluense]MBW9158282.1 hypothetical protein [Clostridium tagluense]MCB2310243.1 hypothetical protein [Clostridium tagluense]MCB2315115.1 hypothetical protein [Clostridium tagluense]MCB2319943.1 hypothetical protein [Clostridium tagluense]